MGAFEKITAILMAGQSNMAGRGDIADVEPIVNDKCRMLRMGLWQNMSEPVNPDRGVYYGNKYLSGVSLAASFADEYAKFYGEYIGLVPCASGGSSIDRWMPGEVLFDNAVMNASLAMRSADMGGIIWHQGEADCKDASLLPQYKEKLIKVIYGLRCAIGNEKLPVVIGELGYGAGELWGIKDNIPLMNEILHTAAEEIPYCGIASAKGLTLKTDGVHFDSVSCREMGRRYFEEFRKIKDCME